MNLLEVIKQNAIKHNKRIVLPEGLEERTIKAANSIIEEGVAKITLIGNRGKILEKAKSYGLKYIDQAIIVDPLKHAKKEQYIDLMVELRKNKGSDKRRSQ